MDPNLRTEIVNLFDADVVRYDLQSVPMLAHYTSLDALQKIVCGGEIWFSNPLLMNDHEEVRWGILQGAAAVEQSPMLRISLKGVRYQIFTQGFRQAVIDYGDAHLFDTYVFCLSEHATGDADGRLSMWRGYGGNGTGAAIVFDPKKLNVLQSSPLILDKVQYKTTKDRLDWIAVFIELINAALQTHQIADEDLPEFSRIAFERLKIAAIFSKHIGFAEEQEWRVVYMPDRDPNGVFRPYLGYLNGAKGLEPKLKFKLTPIPGVTAPDLSLEKLIDSIILGPSRASFLVEGSAKRMFEEAGRDVLKQRLRVSQIPFRSSI